MTHVTYWQQQVNLFENKIQEFEEIGRPVLDVYRERLTLAKASLKIWRAE